MFKSTQSHKIIFQLIADILSYKVNAVDLSLQLQNSIIDWEKFVRIGSSHLVLTTLYCRLRQKNLLDELPEDLQTYLKELTTINRNRNITLLEEINDISTFLKDHQINHVFLKGSALLAGNYYKDVGERMIGDIDILVEGNQLEQAFNLLASLGYSENVSFNYDVKHHRHLARQVSKNKLAAIELHKSIINDNYVNLIDSHDLLTNKKIVNGIAIPKEDDLIRSIILSYQISSYGYYYNTVHLKYIYDCLVLDIESNKTLLKKIIQEKYSASFIALANIHFPEIEVFNQSFNTQRSKLYYDLSLYNRQLGSFLYKTKHNYKNITNRFYLVVFNKSYRKHILSKILSRH